MTDDDLLRQFISAVAVEREGAFRLLVNRHLPLVYAAARRQLGDVHDADDAAQAVFLLLARKASILPQATILPAWLLTVTHYVCKDARKRAARRLKHERKAATMPPSTTTVSPELSSDAAGIAPYLDAALATLAPSDRAAIILRYLKSEPLPAIAEALHLSEAATQKRIERALKKLRAYFARRDKILTLAAVPAAVAAHSTSAAASAHLAATVTATALSAQAAPVGILALAAASARALFWTPAKIGAAAVLLFTALITGVTVLAVSHVQASTPAAVPTPATAIAETPASPAQIRARELLYQLRYEVVFSKTQETYADIRELSQLGKPVVPDICAELDRTTSDSAQRYLAFTLRIINDRRAIPALIHALPFTRPDSSDCGDTIFDRPLWQFVHDHTIPNKYPEPYPRVEIPRSDSEIVAALKALTGHAVSSTTSFSSEARRDAEADLWQDWWDQYAKELLTPEEFTAAAFPAPQGDPVAAAGIARYGVLFPTGSGIHLGPVHELALPPQDLWDAGALLHFSTGQRFFLFQNDSDPQANQANYLQWFNEMQIDTMSVTYVINATKDEHTNGMATNAPHYSSFLAGHDLRIWFVDNARWDTMAAEAASDQPLALGDLGPEHNFNCRNLDTGEISPITYPATFFFLTADNTRGILQILPSSDNSQTVTFRYRLFEGIPRAHVASAPIPPPRQNLPQNHKFSPEKSVTLVAPPSAQPCALDLDTGIIRPSDLHTGPGSPPNQFRPWLASWKGDLIVQPEKAGEKLSILHTADMAIFPCTTAAWKALSPNDTLAIAALRPAAANDFISAEYEQQSPPTYAFKTREGAVGLLQITEATPAFVTLHFKLVIPHAPQ